MNFPRHKCGLYLTHNEHRDIYESLAEWIARNGEVYRWDSEESMQRAIQYDECWTLQWYPETPVGFYAVAAPTFEECLAFARQVENS